MGRQLGTERRRSKVKRGALKCEALSSPGECRGESKPCSANSTVATLELRSGANSSEVNKWGRSVCDFAPQNNQGLGEVFGAKNSEELQWPDKGRLEEIRWSQES